MLPILSPKQIEAPKFPADLLDRLANFSEVIALARGYVPRGSRDQEINGLPEVESNTRLPQELAQLGRGAAALMYHESVTEEDFELVMRAGWDTVPTVRRAILEALLAGRKPHTVGLPSSSVDRQLEDLVVIGLVKKDVLNFGGGMRESEYLLSDKAMEYLSLAGVDTGAAEERRKQRELEQK